MAGYQRVQSQVKHDFLMPDADHRMLQEIFLDHSLSSIAAKPTIVAQLAQLLSAFKLDCPTSVYRYAKKEEMIFRGTDSRNFVAQAVDRYYTKVAPSKTPGTNLTLALRAAEADIKKFRVVAPNSPVVLLIGSDGGAEDKAQARIVAARLAKDRQTYIFFFGTLVTNRLREQALYTLKPFADDDRLFVSNAEDFKINLDRFTQKVQAAIPAQAPKVP